MISIITPAHNEEDWIEACLVSALSAAEAVPVPVEHIVVLNRCTDGTAEIARRAGAVVVREDARNLSRIRNTGVAAARGDIIVTIDADSRMSANMLAEVLRRMRSGRYVGGGVHMLPERVSPGIFFSVLVAAPYILRYGVSAGMFWCAKTDFTAIGGFDEGLVSIEDLDFGRRLKRWGRVKGLRYGTIWRAHIVTSCRKFDLFGDWYLAKKPGVVRRLFQRDSREADRFYYDVRADPNYIEKGSKGSGASQGP